MNVTEWALAQGLSAELRLAASCALPQHKDMAIGLIAEVYAAEQVALFGADSVVVLVEGTPLWIEAAWVFLDPDLVETQDHSFFVERKGLVHADLGGDFLGFAIEILPLEGRSRTIVVKLPSAEA